VCALLVHTTAAACEGGEDDEYGGSVKPELVFVAFAEITPPTASLPVACSKTFSQNSSASSASKPSV
jgi:hypothetical protein